MVEDSRAKRKTFITEISYLVVNECRLAMFIYNMDISRLIVHAPQIEEQKLRQVSGELKRTRVEDGNCSKTIFEIQDKPRFKKGFSNQGPSNTPRVNKGKASTPKYQGKGGSPYI